MINNDKLVCQVTDKINNIKLLKKENGDGIMTLLII